MGPWVNVSESWYYTSTTFSVVLTSSTPAYGPAHRENRT